MLYWILQVLRFIGALIAAVLAVFAMLAGAWITVGLLVVAGVLWFWGMNPAGMHLLWGVGLSVVVFIASFLLPVVLAVASWNPFAQKPAAPVVVNTCSAYDQYGQPIITGSVWPNCATVRQSVATVVVKGSLSVGHGL